MVWGCISYEGQGKLVVVDTTLDRYGYSLILSGNLFDVIAYMRDHNEVLFQQDNAPCHKTRHTSDFFEANKITIEVASVITRFESNKKLNGFYEMYSKKINIKTKKDLVTKVMLISSNIPKSFIKKLYNNIPKRIEEVLPVKGGYTIIKFFSALFN